jgi:hypothetical protein
MIGVTWTAVQNSLLAFYRSMDALRIRQLRCQIRMTLYTALAHAVGIPGGGVTFRAVGFNFGMRTNPAQACSALRIQTSGSEETAACRQCARSDDKQGKD